MCNNHPNKMDKIHYEIMFPLVEFEIQISIVSSQQVSNLICHYHFDESVIIIKYSLKLYKFL